MKLFLRLFLVFSLLAVGQIAFAQEDGKDQKTFHSSRIFAGFFGTGGSAGDLPKGGGGVMLGLGVWNIDVYGEISSYGFTNDLHAETVYDDIEYSQNFEESRVSLNARYYVMHHKFFAPYVGGHIGISDLYQDNSIGSDSSDDYEEHYFYGPTVGIQIFPIPTSRFNAFIELSYNKYSSTYRAYEVESEGLMGGWKKKKGDDINLDSFSITGGVTCTFF